MNRVPWVLVVGLVGCGAYTDARARAARIDALVADARDAGALRCAPRELALATAHLGFARDELDAGDPARAEEHLVLAEPNARAALFLSPAERCGVGVAATAETEDRDGDGVADDADACPDVPGAPGTDGCPDAGTRPAGEAMSDTDTDGDGQPDATDFCLLEPEDRDGYMDEDGCPDPDDDLDRVPDDADACRGQAEDRDGFEDEDGCPDLDNDGDGIADVGDRCPQIAGVRALFGCPREYPGVSVASDRIVLARPLTFVGDSDQLTLDAARLLDTVGQLLQDHPEMRVEIQGHTDSEGTDEDNLRRTQERADAVRRYLVERSQIAPSRLEAHGYGESQPVASNSTPEGRAENRRIELVLRTDVTAGTQQQ